MAHTLLLADDSLTIQRVVQLTFAGQGVNVVTAADGQLALDRLGELTPDIVLADIAMPKVDGYEVARFVRRTDRLAKVPVLLMAGAFESVDEARVKASGAAGVLVKPFEPNAVISRVKELLGLGGRDPQPSGRLVTSADTPAGRAPAPPPPARPAAPPKPPAVRPADEPPDAAWEMLRAESGLGPDSVETGASAGDDDLDLDAAFDTLDAKLAGRSGPRGRATHRPPAPRLPAALDPARSPRPQGASDDGSPVFEVDAGWFDDGPAEAAAEIPVDPEEAAEDDALLEAFAREEAVRPARRAAALAAGEWDVPGAAQAAPGAAPARAGTPDATRVQAPAPTAAPWAPAPTADVPAASRAPEARQAAVPGPAAEDAPAPPADQWRATFAGPPPVADAFAYLLASEQGESPAAPAGAPPPDLVDAVARQVVERLDERVLAEALKTAFSGLVERTVRETIGGMADQLLRREAADRAEQVVRAEVDRVAEGAVRAAAGEVAERLVRDEITRIREAAARRTGTE
ncbi:MAG: response regulator [Vicinamibacterales bacterium]